MKSADAKLLRRLLRERGHEPGFINVMVATYGEDAVKRAVAVIQKHIGRKWEEPKQSAEWKDKPVQGYVVHKRKKDAP